MLMGLFTALHIFLGTPSGIAEIHQQIISLEPSNLAAIYDKIQRMSLPDLKKQLQNKAIIDKNLTVRDVYAGIIMVYGYSPLNEDSKVKEIASFESNGVTCRVHFPDFSDDQFRRFIENLNSFKFPGEKSTFVETFLKSKLIIETGSHESPSMGSYSIRLFENEEFITGLVIPRDGKIVNTWLTRADFESLSDDQLLFVWTRSAGSGAYGTLHVFEIAETGSIKKQDISYQPMKGYMGVQRQLELRMSDN